MSSIPRIVKDAAFYRNRRGTLMIMVTGRFSHRALPLTAKVGRIHVEGISISNDGKTFSGILPEAPNSGDELVVQYPPEPPVRTGVHYAVPTS